MNNIIPMKILQPLKKLPKQTLDYPAQNPPSAPHPPTHSPYVALAHHTLTKTKPHPNLIKKLRQIL